MIRHVFYLCASILATIGVIREDVTAVGAAIAVAILTVAEELFLARLEQHHNAHVIAEAWQRVRERERP